VHSTDVYEEVVRGAAVCGLAFGGPVDLRIRSKITRRPYYRFIEGAVVPATDSVAAQCRFHHDDRPWLALVGESSELVSVRRPYDEGPAARHGVVLDRMARLTGETGLRPIEAVTALAVLLHKRALFPPSGKRWMLGRLTLSRPLAPPDAATLAIAIEKLTGTTMTRSSITGHDGIIGTMVFILADG
jgi:hypothetical protein